MKITNGTATVSVEATIHGESRSLGKPEKAVWELVMRKSGELLKRCINGCLSLRSGSAGLPGLRKYGVLAVFGA